MPADKDGAKDTILVIDDEPLIRTALAETLRRAGFSVVELSEAKEALGHLSEVGLPTL